MEIFNEKDRDLLECLASGWNTLDTAIELGIPYFQAMQGIDTLRLKLGVDSETPDYVFRRKLRGLIGGCRS